MTSIEHAALFPRFRSSPFSNAARQPHHLMKPHALIACLPLVLAACDRASSDTTAAAPAAAATTVRTIHPESGGITRTLRLPGNVRAWQETTVHAKIAGYLKAIHADIGDSVKQGDLLAEIEAPEMLAARLKAEVEAKVAEREYTRVSEARAKASDLVMPQTVDDAKGRLDVARAELDRLDTLLAYARLSAPFDAIVTARHTDPGAFIPAATSSSSVEKAVLLHLADFRKVRIEIDVPEVEIRHLKPGLVVHVTCQASTGTDFTGTVARIAYTLNPQTKTMKAEVEMDNPSLALRPGMMATVKLEIERRENVLLLPATALVVEKSKVFVFLARDGKAVRTAVLTGFDDGKSVEITSGLTTTDAVIDAGRQKLSDGQAITLQATEK